MIDFKNISSRLRDKAKQTFVNVAISLNVETKNVKFETILENTFNVLESTPDKGKFTREQRAVYNVFKQLEYSDNRADRETQLTPSKNGVCWYIKANLINDCLTNGKADFKAIASKAFALFGGKNIASRYNMVKRQASYYMPREMQVDFNVSKNGTCTLVNVDYVNAKIKRGKIDLSPVNWTKKDILK